MVNGYEVQSSSRGVPAGATRRPGNVGTRARAWKRGANSTFRKVDRWAQGYFNALAQARNRKQLTCKCEWNRYDSFC